MAIEALNTTQLLFVEAFLGPANGLAAEAARLIGLGAPETTGPRI
jgi:hypothetical protein